MTFSDVKNKISLKWNKLEENFKLDKNFCLNHEFFMSNPTQPLRKIFNASFSHDSAFP